MSVGPSLAQGTIHAEDSMLLSAYIRNQPLGEVSQKLHNTVVSRVNAHGHLEFTGKKKREDAYTDKPFVCSCIMRIYANHTMINNGK